MYLRYEDGYKYRNAFTENILVLWYFSFRIYLLSWYCWRDIGVSLQALKLNMTHITPSRNIINIEHTASAGFILLIYLSILHLEKENLYRLVKNRQLHCICRFSTDIFIFFSQYQPRGLFLKYYWNFAISVSMFYLIKIFL